jgi:type I restriction enzyme S subunit
MSYKTYPSTVRSGVGWLGDVPSHWSVVPAKALFSLRTEKALPGDIHLTPSQKFGVLPQIEYMEVSGGRVVLNLKDSGQMKHVEPSDFVSHLRSFQGGLEISRIRGKVSGAYTVLKPRRDQNPDYWKYALKSDTYIQGLQTTTDQLRDGQSIRLKEFSQIPLPLVPRAEQDAIVLFLEQELSQLDKLIELQRTLSLLASEQLEAKILQAVSGQDLKSKRRKHPNMVWSPDLPEGWGATTIRHFAKVFAGGTPDRGNPSFWEDGDLPWINSGAVNQGKIMAPSALINQAAVKGSSTRLVPKDALVIALAGQGATKGTPALMGIDAFCNQSMAAIVCDSRVESRFLYFWLRANYLNIRSMGGGDLRDGLNLEHIKSISCPIPPKRIQIQIAEELEIAVKRGEQLRDLLHLTITKLQERRAAVVSAAVTGKIDVLGLSHG